MNTKHSILFFSISTNGSQRAPDGLLFANRCLCFVKAEEYREKQAKHNVQYQNELPKKIKARGKDAHLNHEELVQLMKWKQTGGKFYPQLNYLVKVNTPRAVMMETKKAFKKLPNLELALSALSNLKGVGTTLASALLAAATPEVAPFMADECLMAIPEIEGIDYTTKEYLKFVNFINNTVERLNKESKNGTGTWNAHQVELALWTHYVAAELKPELLEDIRSLSSNNTNNTNGNSTTHVNGTNQALDTCSDESNLEPATQNNKPDESTVPAASSLPSEPEDTSSLQSLPSEKSLDDGSIGNNHTDDVTNDSVMTLGAESDTNTNDLPDPSTPTNNPPAPSQVEMDGADDNASAEPPLKKTKLSEPENEVANNGESSEAAKPEKNGASEPESVSESEAPVTKEGEQKVPVEPTAPVPVESKTE
ncbi:uncharacterized protein LOC103506312 [Diaphorina citri]|uniref:Uncharacterized protein LOC103506312 n=1 Tax=Diaphorina citri TaxID=121845 RepID=A0A1S3CVX4_DIACI|nr:uncharacterized protein LOC103506312 [Diaphorina citri]